MHDSSHIKRLFESSGYKDVVVSEKFYGELLALEVDTADGDSSPIHQKVADKISRAVKVGSSRKMSLDPADIKYFLENSIPNMLDIFEDGRKTGLLKQLEKFKISLKS